MPPVLGKKTCLGSRAGVITSSILTYMLLQDFGISRGYGSLSAIAQSSHRARDMSLAVFVLSNGGLTWLPMSVNPAAIGMLLLTLSLVVRTEGDLLNSVDAPLGSLDRLGKSVDNSWVQQLDPDPEQERHIPNQMRREVFSGHYVFVRPKALPEPYLVACSQEMAALLRLNASECTTDRFVHVFSGDVEQLAPFGSSWATPYALSIYGQEPYMSIHGS